MAPPRRGHRFRCPICGTIIFRRALNRIPSALGEHRASRHPTHRGRIVYRAVLSDDQQRRMAAEIRCGDTFIRSLQKGEC